MRIVRALRLSAIFLLPVAALHAQSQGSAGAPALRTVITRADALAASRARVRAGDVRLKPAVDALVRASEKALSAPIVAVTDKRTLLPPSNDRHDYFSLSPYWWPDSSKSDGLPYIRRDGVTNPESKRDLDQPRVAAMGDRVHTLALGWYFTGDTRYSKRAAQQLRAWFVDSATRMTPHLRFSQLVRGNPEERGSGIIDTRWFVEAVDAAGVLEGAPGWTDADGLAMRTWFRQYLAWLRNSPNGAHERAAKNNHGSWYAAQTAAYALFVGDTALAREIVVGVRERIGSQIRPDGSQPEENARTRSFHYSNFNVEALSRLAEMARVVGVDLWSYQAPNGGSIARALARMAPYVDRQQEWPDPQLDPVSSDALLTTFRRARMATGDATYDAVVARLPEADRRRDISALLYPPSIEAPSSRPILKREQAAVTGTAGGVLASDPRVTDHPRIFITRAEATAIRAALGKYPMLDREIALAKESVARALAAPLDAPQPGEAGGYAHEKHKQNYRDMQAAGTLFAITGDRRYALFVRDLLEKYAVLYPTLGAHPLSKNQAPGKLFHQSLNEANWLVAVSIAYDCVYDALTAVERARFERNVLRPMADWMAVTQAKEFDRIHNHGTWAVAGVGMLGFVIGDTSYVNKALYGTKGDRSGGFLRQLDLLFSPDGYYMEGPYYIRYALMPFFHFAEAVERAKPDVHIYAYRDSILKKGLYAAVQTAFPNGVFPPINDASRSMAIDAPEVVLALDLAYARYGADPNLLAASAIQSHVILSGAGLTVARDLAARRTPPVVAWKSIEFTDGSDGKRGGLGVLRMGTGPDASMLLMKYGVHGEGHGHFDKLHFSFFDGGREVVPDYGFSRWINIEPKFGGRYLPENDSYAMQTIAHNTLVVDQRSQNDANEKADEAVSGERHFFETSNPNVQAMSARADRHYAGVAMQRTMLLVRDARLPYPVVVDLYNVRSAATHFYDWPLHFRGQLIASNVRYDAATSRLDALGKGFGYEHLWREASGVTDSLVQLTWLDGHRYYSATVAASPRSEVYFARTGAGDPSFNLTREPLMIVRRSAGDHLFAAVVEPHGLFDEAQERSVQARPIVQSVRVLASTPEGSVVEVSGTGGLSWTIMVNNGPASRTATHRVTVAGQTWEWVGNVAIRGLAAPR